MARRLGVTGLQLERESKRKRVTHLVVYAQRPKDEREREREWRE
jgi:hypothetical protein